MLVAVPQVILRFIFHFYFFVFLIKKKKIMLKKN